MKRKRWPCHGCGRPLTADDLARNSTTHWFPSCMREAIRRSEVREARREGIPVARWRELQAAARSKLQNARLSGPQRPARKDAE